MELINYLLTITRIPSVFMEGIGLRNLFPRIAASLMPYPALLRNHRYTRRSAVTLPCINSGLVVGNNKDMDSPIRAVQSTYYGDTSIRQNPPDLESMLLKERIVYLGLPLVSPEEYKQQLGIDVTELIIAQLLYLQYDDPDKPVYIYINSTGTSWYTGEAIGFETEAFAICDTINYIKPPVHTICIGQAMGTAAMILSAGTKGCRASLPNGTIILHQARRRTGGQATDIQIQAKEVLANKKMMVNILSQNTGQAPEKLTKDMDRMFYMTPQEAKEYGLIDRVLESSRELPQTAIAAHS